MSFARPFTVGWGDMDFNGHMRNTAYLDMSGTARMQYFESRGFSMQEFSRVKFGPVITRDAIEYYKELHLLDVITVTVELAGLSPDGARFRFRNDFLRPDGKRAASVVSDGGWLSLEHRRLAPPPEALAEVLHALARSEDYEVLPGLSER